MKKFLSLVLALVIVLGTFGNVALADEEKLEYNTQESKIQWLIDKEIVIGRKVNADGSAELDLDETLTRAEVTKLIVYTLKLQNLADALKGVMKPFPDVDIDHWANGYVSVATTQREDVAFGRRIVIGYEDGKFYPENNVTYAELATMLVRIVKEDLTPQMERDAIWATSYMRWAEEEGILKGITVLDSDKPVIRRDAFEMIFNAMYALGDYNKAAINFGDDIGIVSKLKDGILEVNQEKEYKVTRDTQVTDGTTWSSLGDNADKIWAGSLIRYIVNEDNEVTYIIELGKPMDYPVERTVDQYGNYRFNGGPINRRGWRGVIDDTADLIRGYGLFTVDNSGKFRDLLVEYGVDADNDELYFGLEINKDTRLFVADVRNNALKELKSLDEVYNYWNLAGGREIGPVYAGYDKFKTRVNGAKYDVAEAKVVVFCNVDKYQGYDEVRRVTDWLNSAKRYGVEDTKGEVEYLTIDKLSAFPSILLNEIDYRDVVRIREGAHDPYAERDVVEVIIDYSDDPVFEVAKVSNRLITLRDEDNYEREFAIDRDAYVFLEGQLKKGAHVQVAWDEFLNKYADIYGTGDDLYRYDVIKYISVVDKALEGELEEGIRTGTDSGYIIKISDYAGQIDTVAITIADNKNGRNPRSYLVSREDLPFFYDTAINQPEDIIGEEVLFEIVRRFDADYVFAVEFKMTQEEQDVQRDLVAYLKNLPIKDEKGLKAAKAMLKEADANGGTLNAQAQAAYDRIESAVKGYEAAREADAALKKLPALDKIKPEDKDDVLAARKALDEVAKYSNKDNKEYLPVQEDVDAFEEKEQKMNILVAWIDLVAKRADVNAYKSANLNQKEDIEAAIAELDEFKAIYDAASDNVKADADVVTRATWYNNRVTAIDNNGDAAALGLKATPIA